MIRFDKFTLKSQEALQAAQTHAQEKGNPQIAPEHLLWALVQQKDGVVLPVLQKLGADIQVLAQELGKASAKLPKVEGQSEIQLSPALSRILEDAQKEADQFKDDYVSTEHILIALSSAKGEAVAKLLQAQGITQSLTQGADRLQPLFISILQERYHPRSIILRNDSKVRELEGLPIAQSWVGEEPPATVVVDEDGKQMEIALTTGQKTGGYLDQRDNHRAARRYARGRALDGFCYGGGFALHLADVCDSVEAVDSSPTAVRLAEANASRNGLKNVQCIEANVFDLLRERSSQGERFDTIVLDPPAFARNKESLEGALRGYKEINNRAMRLLKDGGVLVTCTCSHHVSEGLFAEMLAEAARDAGCWLRVLERRIQSADHPILMAVPETLYLKCFIVEIVH